MTSTNPTDTYYMPGGEPFFFRGNDIGCLCLHGLNAVPQEMLWLGKHLAARGWTVYGPRLTGHGTSIEDMRHTTWSDWYGVALDGYRVLRQQCRKVFVLGLSLGGLLSLHLGTREQPDGIVDLAGPLTLDQPLLPYARLIGLVRPYTANTPDENFHRIDSRMRTLQEERGEPVIGRAAYGHFPMASLAEMHDLQRVTQERLPTLTTPLLLVYSEADRTVPFANMAMVAEAVGTPPADLHQLRLERSDHLLTLDEEMETVFATATDFVGRYAG